MSLTTTAILSLRRIFCRLRRVKQEAGEGGSPGLVVMGVDSRSKGRGFESQRRILDGHFFTLICCKNCIVCLKKTENKRKRGLAQFLKKKQEAGGLKISLEKPSPCLQGAMKFKNILPASQCFKHI